MPPLSPETWRCKNASGTRARRSMIGEPTPMRSKLGAEAGALEFISNLPYCRAEKISRAKDAEAAEGDSFRGELCDRRVSSPSHAETVRLVAKSGSSSISTSNEYS